MKKSLLIVSAMMALLASCSNSEYNEQEAVPVSITAGLNETATRAQGANWNNDKIGVSVTSDTKGTMTKAANTNVQYATTSTGTSATFTPVADNILFNAAYEGTATFAAYGPYAATTTDNLVEIDTSKNNDTSDNQETNLDYIFASGATATLANPAVSFVGNSAFNHKMVQLNLSITTVKTNDLTQSVADVTSIKLGGLIHKGTFNILDGTVKTTGNVVDDWEIKDLYKTVNGDTYTYSLILLPQTLNSALPLSITVGGKTYVNKAGIKPDMTAGGKSLNYSINVQGNVGITISGCTINNWTQTDKVVDDAFQE